MDELEMAINRRMNPRNKLGSAISRFGSILATGREPANTNDDALERLYAQEAIKRQFQNPEEERLKLENIRSQIENRAAENQAMATPLPPGLIRVGRQVVGDPNFIKPEEQRKMEEADALKQAQVEELKSSAQQSINAIEEAKKGKDFFGPFGDIPSKYAPSSFLGMGNYNERSNWESNVNNLLSKKVVDLIGQMKSLSKTGATGFGQLSEKEGQILREASTVLNKNLPPDRAVYYLNEMEKIYQKILGGGQFENQQPNEFSSMSDDELRKIAGMA